MDFKNKELELFVEDFDIAENIDTGIITISGYANRYKSEEGQLVIDRSSESVMPSGYDLQSYKKNPILLYQHDKSRPIGKIVALELRSDGLYVEANVHDMLDHQAYYAVKHSILKTFSIGFIVKDYTEVDDVYFWTEIELLEISIVSVPDNQESTFNVLLDSPCNGGTCALAAKKVSETRTKDTKTWSSVDKSVLLSDIEKLADEDVVKEAYLIVKDVSKPSTWKFPHHYLDEETKELSLLKAGLDSALSALKGAKDAENHALEDKIAAVSHLQKHYDSLLADGVVDNIPDGLKELADYFEEKQMSITKEENTPGAGAGEGGEGGNEQPPKDDTINTPANTEDGGDAGSQNPNPEEDGASGNEPEGTKVISIEDVDSFVESAKNSPEGLNTLLSLYASLEASINEALPKLLEEDKN